MNSRMHSSEDALAELGCAHVKNTSNAKVFQVHRSSYHYWSGRKKNIKPEKIKQLAQVRRIHGLSNEHLAIPNTLSREFTVDKPNQAWCGDVTYVWTGKRWSYLPLS